MALKEDRRQGCSHGYTGGKEARIQPLLYWKKDRKETAIWLYSRQGYSHDTEGGNEARIQPWL